MKNFTTTALTEVYVHIHDTHIFKQAFILLRVRDYGVFRICTCTLLPQLQLLKTGIFKLYYHVHIHSLIRISSMQYEETFIGDHLGLATKAGAFTTHRSTVMLPDHFALLTQQIPFP